jgi:hypothetical protein
MAVTGVLPFRSCSPLDAFMKKCQNEFTPPREIVPTLSERVDWAIRRAMSADPNARPTNCREFVEDLTGRSTRRVPLAGAGPSQQDLWYITYEDDEGVSQVVKGTLAAIRRCLRDGLLGDAENVRVSRAKAGPYEPLRTHPEFRDLVVAPRVLSLPKRSSSRSGLRPAKPSATESEPTVKSRPLNTPRGATYQAPQIDFGSAEDRESSSDWRTWLLVLLVVAASFSIGFWFFFLGR